MRTSNELSDNYLSVADHRLNQVEDSLQRSFAVIRSEAEVKDAEVRRRAKVIRDEGGKWASKRIWVRTDVETIGHENYILFIIFLE